MPRWSRPCPCPIAVPQVVAFRNFWGVANGNPWSTMDRWTISISSMRARYYRFPMRRTHRYHRNWSVEQSGDSSLDQLFEPKWRFGSKRIYDARGTLRVDNASGSHRIWARYTRNRLTCMGEGTIASSHAKFIISEIIIFVTWGNSSLTDACKAFAGVPCSHRIAPGRIISPHLDPGGGNPNDTKSLIWYQKFIQNRFSRLSHRPIAMVPMRAPHGKTVIPCPHARY